MIDFDLLARIIHAPDAPALEKSARKMFTPLPEGLDDDVYTYHIGNLIERRKGSEPQELKNYSFL